MKEAEAESLVALMFAAFSNLTPETLDLFKTRLLPMDADVASPAIIKAIDYWRTQPRWADIREAIRIEHDQRVYAEPRPPDALRDGPLPFWVRKWACARFLYPRFNREQDMRPFPQQFDRGQIPPGVDLMPDEEWAEEANTIDIAEAWKAIRSGGSA